MSRERLIRKLLKHHHLNRVERQQLAPPSVGVEEICSVIRADLEKKSVFGSLGYQVERIADGKYRTATEVEVSMSQTATAHEEFNSLESAVFGFVRLILRSHAHLYPGTIDGIEVAGTELLDRLNITERP